MPEQPLEFCPNCGAKLMRGGRACISCRLETAKMPAFAAAKRAASARGIAEADNTPDSIPLWRQPKIIASVLILLLLLGIVFFRKIVPVTPPWAHLPADPNALIHTFLDDIATGTDPGYLQAYDLVAPSVKDKNNSSEEGDYRQIYHIMNKYLSSEFGPDWNKTVTLEKDPNDPNNFIVHVDIETLTIHVQDETPKDKQSPGHEHYGVTRVDQFGVEQAAALRKNAAISGVIRAAGGGDVGNSNLDAIRNYSSPANEPPMARKLRLLPVLGNPRAANKREVIETWPGRQDPVIRRRLQMITEDERYGMDVRQSAKEVLTDSVPEEERIAVGVPDY